MPEDAHESVHRCIGSRLRGIATSNKERQASPRLLHNISDTGGRVYLQLTLTFAKHVLDGTKVLLVVVLVLTEFRSCGVSAFGEVGRTRCGIPSELKKIRPDFLLGVNVHLHRDNPKCTYSRLLSCFAKTFAIEGQNLALKTRQACHCEQRCCVSELR